MSSTRLLKAGNQLLGMFCAVLQAAEIGSDTALKITDKDTGESVQITVLDAVQAWVAAAKSQPPADPDHLLTPNQD